MGLNTWGSAPTPHNTRYVCSFCCFFFNQDGSGARTWMRSLCPVAPAGREVVRRRRKQELGRYGKVAKV